MWRLLLPKPVPRRLRTPEEAAIRLSISASTVLRLYDSGELVGMDMAPKAAKGKKQRHMLRFRDEDLERFEQQRFASAGE